MIVLVAPDLRQAQWWCYQQIPAVNPRSVVKLTCGADTQRLRGVRYKPGLDQVVVYNPYHVRDLGEIVDALKMFGWDGYHPDLVTDDEGPGVLLSELLEPSP